jgi:hypothetical protein
MAPHLCLSLGERENRAPLGGESNALGCATISVLNRGANGAGGSDVQLNWCFERYLSPHPGPLPRGEGESRAAFRPNIENFTYFSSFAVGAFGERALPLHLGDDSLAFRHAVK